MRRAKKDRLEWLKLNRFLLIGIIIFFFFMTEITALNIGGKIGSFFNGTMDEVAIYNRTLTLVEIIEHYLFNKTQTTQDIKASVNQSWDIDNDNITIAYRWYKNNILNASTIHNETSLMAYYPFDNDARDYARDNNASLVNATLISAGKISGAYEFDGIDDFINISDDSSLNFPFGNFTIAVWIKPNVADDSDVFIAKSSGGGASTSYGYLASLESNTIKFYTANDSVLWGSAGTFSMTTNAIINTDKWYHIVIVIDKTGNANSKIYINGTDETSSRSGDITTVGNISNNLNLVIGSNSSVSNRFNGTIDEVAIYNRTLTAAEIYQHYIAGRWGGYRIDDSYTSAGENWTIETQVVDYAHWGSVYNSSTIVIQGAQITLTAVINSSPTNANTTNETLWCYNTSQSLDIDAEITISYAWYNNSIITQFTDQFIGYYNTTKGQNWTCEITAVAEATTTRFNSTSLKILNSPPFFNVTIPNIQVSTRTSLSIPAVNVTDVDGDVINYYTNDSIISIISGIINDTVIPESDARIYTINISADDGEINISQIITYTINDTIPPTYSAFQNNASTVTKINGYVNWSVTLADGASLSHYIFSFNNSGSFVADPAVKISGTSMFVNVTKQVTTPHAYICGNFTFNDTNNNWNSTNLSCFSMVNSIPSLSVIINSSPTNANTTNETLWCYNVSQSDADNDAITISYAWYKNNVAQPSLTSNSVASSNTTKGEDWICEINATDGTDYNRINSTTLTILNSQPIIVNVSISPSSPFTNNTLIGYCNATDVDNDKVAYDYKWYLNNVVNISETTIKANSIDTGGYFTCGIRVSDSRVLCWGMGNNGRLGDGNTATHNVLNPTLTTDTSAYSMVSVGNDHACGIRANDSRVLCWGYNSYAQLGDGTITEKGNPTLISDTSAYSDISAAEYHTCGIRSNDSKVLCWGDNNNGQLGDGTTTQRLNPVLTTDTSAYKDIITIMISTCGIRANDSRVLCWGDNAFGQLGNGSTGDASNPQLTNDTSAYSSIGDSGIETDYHVCGIRANDSRVLCWGYNANGELGNGSTGNAFNPQLINDTSAYRSISTGRSLTCGIRTSDSRALCWGDNYFGQIGDGTTTDRYNPTLINDSSTYSFVSAGFYHSCGIRINDSRVLCWGDNQYGQLGDGTTTDSNNSKLTSDSSPYLTGFYNESLEINIYNLSISKTSKGENWTLSCRGYDAFDYGSWLNSSTLTILNSPPYINTTIPNITQNTRIAWSIDAINCTDVDGDIITYYLNDSRITVDSAGILNDTAIEADAGINVINASCDDGTINASQTFTYTVNDTIPPTYSAFQNNASSVTKINGYVNWSVILADGASLSHYIFSFNNSGSFVADPAVKISGTSMFVNVTKQVTTPHAYICANFTFNDTNNNWNSTDLSCFTMINTISKVIAIINSTPANLNLTTSTLECYNTSQSDADSDAITLTYNWYNSSNGATYTEMSFTTNSLSQDNTTKGQYFICQINAYDDYDYNRTNSTSLEILNSIPYTKVIINSTPANRNLTTSTLWIFNYSQGDSDEDALTISYRWYNSSNGITYILMPYTGNNLSSSNTTKGQYFIGEITVSDGTVTNASNSTSLLILNTPPYQGIPVINSSPTNANTTNETLWCYNISQSDDDNDALTRTFLWYKDNTKTTETSQSVAITSTTKGEVWLCEISLYDSEDYNRTNSTTLTILNSPPFFNVTIPDISEVTGVAWSYAVVNVTDVDGDTLIYSINDSRITLNPPYLNDTAIVADIGTHTINVSVSDGEFNVSQIFTYAIGDFYPTWSGNKTNASFALKKNGSVQINITLEDTVGLSWYAFAWNDTGEMINVSNESISGESFTMVLNKTVTRKGLHAWQVTFNDTAAQWNQTPLFTFDVYNTFPTVPNVTNPGNNSYIQQVDINYSSYDVDDEDTINYTIFINDTFNISTRNNITNLSIGDGVYTLKVSAYDQLNYSLNSTEIIFTKDTTAPVISLEYPGNGALIESGSVMFKYNVSDLTELLNCSLFINNGLAASTNSTIRYTSQNFTKGYEDGDYTWSINCTDTVNNTGNSSIYSFTVKIPPIVGISGPGGGGGGGAIIPKEELIEYEVSEESIEAELILGKADTKTLTIRNTGATKIDVILYPKHLSDYVFISDSKFSLNLNEEKTVMLNMVGKELGAHTGNLIVSASGVRKEIPTVISVKSAQILFDAKIDIPSDYKEISPGEELKAQITLFNIVGGKVDVVVNYIIKDMEGNSISDESEVFAVEGQKSYMKIYKTSELKPGNYVALIEVRYSGSFAVSSEMFSVKEEEIIKLAPQKTTRYTLIYTLLVIILLFMTYILIHLFLKKKKQPKDI